MLKVFYLSIEEMHIEHLENLLTYVSRQRRAKVLRCKFDGDRLRSLGAGLLLAYGERTLPCEKRQYCNVTHSGKYAAVAFSDKPVGIDLEMRGRFAGQEKRMHAVARKAFSPAEQQKLDELLSGNAGAEDFFLTTWTRKEAYAKMLGKGIAMDLSAIDTLDERAFWTSFLREDFCLSICPGAEPVDICNIPFDCLLAQKYDTIAKGGCLHV